jgi:uncharacterized surface protein with fasciclin (FAS1) repeats
MTSRREFTLMSLGGLAALAGCAPTPATPTTAVADPPVGGAPMMATKTIVQNAADSPDLTTLVAAVQAAGLANTLNGPGPFTVFAPTNEAFNALPPGTLQSLMQPANVAKLKALLTYHVVPGSLDTSQMISQLENVDGHGALNTVEGAPLYFTSDGKGGITLTNGGSKTASVIVPNVYQANGMVQVINTVLIPPA